MKLDSHQHFWKYNPAHQIWMTDAMAVLRRDFLPEDLSPLLDQTQFDGTIAVQARRCWRSRRAGRCCSNKRIAGRSRKSIRSLS